MRLESSTVARDEIVDEDLPKGVEIKDVRPGVKLWRNPINKFTVVRVHYTADRKKRSAAWKAEARAGIPFAEWMREYEINFSSFHGVPVYADSFSKHFHVSQESLKWAMEAPVVRGWDFGLDVLGMACVFTQLLTNSRLFVYNELLASDSDIYTFCEAVRRYSLEWFPGCRKFFDIVDPSGFNRDARSRGKKSYCDALRSELGAKPIPGEVSPAKRIQAVTKYLSTNVRGLPKLVLDGENVPTLVEGFTGGYHFAYVKNSSDVKDTPEKNEFSHVHDALQMVASRVDRLDLDDFSNRASDPPAVPQYRFGG